MHGLLYGFWELTLKMQGNIVQNVLQDGDQEE